MSKHDEKHTSELSMDELENVAGGDARVNNELENAAPSAVPASPSPSTVVPATNSRAVSTTGISGS
jgi:hypothetical protein